MGIQFKRSFNSIFRDSLILVKSEECPKLAQKASKLDQKMGLLSKIENIHSIYDTFIHFMKQFDSEDYPACALRALGLILTDNALTVGRGKIF